MHSQLTIAVIPRVGIIGWTINVLALVHCIFFTKAFPLAALCAAVVSLDREAWALRRIFVIAQVRPVALATRPSGCIIRAARQAVDTNAVVAITGAPPCPRGMFAAIALVEGRDLLIAARLGSLSLGRLVVVACVDGLDLDGADRDGRLHGIVIRVRTCAGEPGRPKCAAVAMLVIRPWKRANVAAARGTGALAPSFLPAHAARAGAAGRRSCAG
mmetsp:Transcript_4555/g.14725  ORF Transcript_4555/g.14725 Transcript_4555/m.14725 type:complete len:215 (-) Transcript_4555:80-724(-)|eukprot:scaffold271746_cov27-Tisochrysis_lutea.AAC.2